MKITMNIECTPEEARAFMGLPDVQPLQEALMSAMQERMQIGLQATDPSKMLQAFVPGSADSLQEMQKLFWGGMQQTVQQTMQQTMQNAANIARLASGGGRGNE